MWLLCSYDNNFLDKFWNFLNKDIQDFFTKKIGYPVKNKGLSEPEIRQFCPTQCCVRAFLRISVRLRIFHGNLHVHEVLRTKIRGKIRVGLKISHVLLKFTIKFCHRQLILTRLSNEIYIIKEWGKFQVNI
jgi:hypothetical protein